MHKEVPSRRLMGTHTYGYPILMGTPYLWVPILMGTPYLWVPILMGNLWVPHTYGYPYDFYKFYLYPCTVVKKKILTYLCLNFVQIMVLIL